MLPEFLIALAGWLCGYLIARFGDTAWWWVRWAFHRLAGHHNRNH